MSTGDRLIIAGAVTVPTVCAVALGIDAVANGHSNEWPGILFFASVAVAAGLITTGILMRKNRG